MGSYDEIYRSSIEHPDEFWAAAARDIDWIRQPEVILDDTNPPFYRWFTGGVLNTCYNALDRHADGGRGDQVALVYDSPVTDTMRTYTFEELRNQVATFAGALAKLGVTKGDTVVIYMPMVPEAVVAMLACARLGAIHSVVFGGFAAHELAVRIDDARPRVMISASCGIEVNRVLEYKPLLDKAIEEAAHRPERCIILQRPEAEAKLVEGRDLDWAEAVAGAKPAECVPVAATDPLYVLYTSGTTAQPKGVVRDNGGHAVALRWSLPNVFGSHPGDVFWAASDVGWVVGHSYIVYAPLLTGATTVLFEGKPVGTPDPGAFWRVVSEHGVNVLFTAPTAFRAIKKEDPKGTHLSDHDISSMRALFLAGERLDPDTYHWASDLLGIPVIDHWWQTETGWPVAANCLGLEPLSIKPGSPTKPVPGWAVDILEPSGDLAPAGTEGAICMRLPLPPGSLPTLWGDDERFVKSYLSDFDGYYLSGDGGHVDDDGYLFVMGRVDDVINVAGHRLSTGTIEEALAQHPDVAECAVIGAADEIKGQIPVGLVVLKAGVDRDEDEIARELVQTVREEVGAVASMKRVSVVDRLPKTRSGKILRATMRAIADGKDYQIPSTIEDASALEHIEQRLQSKTGPGTP
jgi:propionyl-CoA synthetase